MREDPFLIDFLRWQRRLNPNLTRHHTIPRSRPTLIGEAQCACRLPAHNLSWNLKTVPSDTHFMWHVMFGRLAPWEVLTLLSQKEVFPNLTQWQAFSWLIVFGDMTPKATAQALNGANGDLWQRCVRIIGPEEAADTVLKCWTTSPLVGYTIDHAG